MQFRGKFRLILRRAGRGRRCRCHFGNQHVSRSVMHLPASPGDGVVPWMLLTKANIGTPNDSYDEPADYPALFEKLWHVG